MVWLQCIYSVSEQDSPADKLYNVYFNSLNTTQLSSALQKVNPVSSDWHPQNKHKSFAKQFEEGLAAEQAQFGVKAQQLLVVRALYLAAESHFLAAAVFARRAPDGGSDGGGRAGWRRTRRRWVAKAQVAPKPEATASGGVNSELVSAANEWVRWGGAEGLYGEAAAEMYRRAAAEEAKAREAYYRAEEAYRQVSA